MNKNNVLESTRRLIRQTIAGLLIANVGLIIFVLIAVGFSLFIRNQFLVIGLSFMMVAPFIIIGYANIYRQDFHLFDQNKSDLGHRTDVALDQQVDVSSRFVLKVFAADFKMIAIWIGIALIDGIFLVIWAYTQIVLNNLIVTYKTNFNNELYLFALQLIFAVATLVPILTHVAITTIRGLVEVWIAIKRELTRLEQNPL